MSKLEIKADIESTEPLFEYDGASIEKPLRELHARLTAEAKKLQDKVGPESKEVPTLTGLISKNPEAEIRSKIKLLLSDALEAHLWANEAKRTPDKVWKLNMHRLKWLYRENA